MSRESARASARCSVAANAPRPCCPSTQRRKTSCYPAPRCPNSSELTRIPSISPCIHSRCINDGPLALAPPLHQHGRRKATRLVLQDDPAADVRLVTRKARAGREREECVGEVRVDEEGAGREGVNGRRQVVEWRGERGVVRDDGCESRAVGVDADVAGDEG